VGTNVVTVTLAALATALATGLGAVPFFFLGSMSRRWIGISNAAAAGFMLSASGALLLEGLIRGPGRVVAGVAVGVAFIAVAPDRRKVRRASLRATRGRRCQEADLDYRGHDGSLFQRGGRRRRCLRRRSGPGHLHHLAIAIHNIPEGLAISLVLVPRGTTVLAAAGWSVFTSLPQPFVAAPAYLFVEAFRPILPAGFGFAAGAMTWLVFAELLPDAQEEMRPRALAAGSAVRSPACRCSSSRSSRADPYW
jgi:zinc transporter, ZIP family